MRGKKRDGPANSVNWNINNRPGSVEASLEPLPATPRKKDQSPKGLLFKPF